MADYEKQIEKINKELVTWLEDVQQHEMVDIVEIVEQAKKYLVAAESIPEEKIKQFLTNLKLDLQEFYQAQVHDAESSSYLGLLGETFWELLAKLSDQSQVQWAEFRHDLNHDGIYKAGDVVGFGVLECMSCFHEVTITHSTKLDVCSECGHDTFSRKALAL